MTRSLYCERLNSRVAFGFLPKPVPASLLSKVESLPFRSRPYFEAFARLRFCAPGTRSHNRAVAFGSNSVRYDMVRARRNSDARVLRRHSRSNVSCRPQPVCLSSIIIGPIAATRDSAGSLRVFISAEVAGAFNQIVRAVLHPCSPFSRLFTGAEKGMQVFHIKSQSNYLTS